MIPIESAHVRDAALEEHKEFQMERDTTLKSAIAAQTIRRSLIWAGVLLGLAIVLKDVIEATEFIYVMSVIIVGWTADQTPLSFSRVSNKWSGLVSAALIIVVAIAVKMVMEW